MSVVNYRINRLLKLGESAIQSGVESGLAIKVLLLVTNKAAIIDYKMLNHIALFTYFDHEYEKEYFNNFSGKKLLGFFSKWNYF